MGSYFRKIILYIHQPRILKVSEIWVIKRVWWSLNYTKSSGVFKYSRDPWSSNQFGQLFYIKILTYFNPFAPEPPVTARAQGG